MRKYLKELNDFIPFVLDVKELEKRNVEERLKIVCSQKAILKLMIMPTHAVCQAVMKAQ